MIYTWKQKLILNIGTCPEYNLCEALKVEYTASALEMINL